MTKYNILLVWIITVLDILQLELGGTPANTTLSSHSSTHLTPPVLALHVEAGEDVAGGGGDGDDHLLRHPALLQVPDEHSEQEMFLLGSNPAD